MWNYTCTWGHLPPKEEDFFLAGLSDSCQRVSEVTTTQRATQKDMAKSQRLSVAVSVRSPPMSLRYCLPHGPWAMDYPLEGYSRNPFVFRCVWGSIPEIQNRQPAGTNLPNLNHPESNLESNRTFRKSNPIQMGWNLSPFVWDLTEERRRSASQLPPERRSKCFTSEGGWGLTSFHEPMGSCHQTTTESFRIRLPKAWLCLSYRGRVACVKRRNASQTPTSESTHDDSRAFHPYPLSAIWQPGAQPL